MAKKALPAGVAVCRYERQDATSSESYTVRWKEPGGVQRRRSFDRLPDALDFKAKRRSAKRWRPEEPRQEQAGRQLLGHFFAQWWVDHAMVELKRSTLATYRCLWEAHAESLREPLGGHGRAQSCETARGVAVLADTGPAKSALLGEPQSRPDSSLRVTLRGSAG